MARVPAFALRKEDIRDLPGGDVLLDALTKYASEVSAAFDGGITFGENANAQILTLDITTKSEDVVLTPVSPWTNLEVAGGDAYRRPTLRKLDSGLVICDGALSAGYAGTVALQIPSAFVPVKKESGVSFGSFEGHETIYRWDVYPTGEIRIGYGLEPTAGCEYFHLHAWWLAADPRPSPNSVFPQRLKYDLGGSPVGVLVLQAVEVVSPREERPVGKALAVEWTMSGGTLLVQNVAGLLPGRRYRLSLLAVGG